MMPKAVIIVGDPINGFTLVGPFDSIFEASDYAESATELNDFEWWVSALEEPKIKEPADE